MNDGQPERKVYLVGFMGTGKTTLGRMLAERMGWRFLDLDGLIEEREGRSIARIFADRGEGYFRLRERGALEALADEAGPAVVACGGGTYCAAANRVLMERTGTVVWLDQPFERIWARRAMLADERPLLQGEESARRLYEERLALYRNAEIHLPVEEGCLVEALDALVARLSVGG